VIEKGKSMNVDIRPLGPVMGVEVHGLDLNQPLDNATKMSLYQGFLDHLLLCVRDQTFKDIGSFLNAARHFGSPKVQQLQGYRAAEFPEAGIVSSEDRDQSGDGKRIVRGTMFHTDESFIATPPKATILYAVDVPNQGGDTRYVNMQAAYDALDNKTKAKIDGLNAVHFYGKDRGNRKVPAMSAAELKAAPPVSHPIVRTHDETKKKAIYVHETMTNFIENVSPEESSALLRQLYTHTTENSDFQYRHQWRKGDFVIWDDRATLHAATADYGEDQRRLLYRTMLAGTATQ
jgi:taurine dioxygenase